MSEEERWIQLIGQLFGKALGPSEYKLKNLEWRNKYKQNEAQREFESEEAEKAARRNAKLKEFQHALTNKSGEVTNPVTGNTVIAGVKVSGKTLDDADNLDIDVSKVKDSEGNVDHYVSKSEYDVIKSDLSRKLKLRQIKDIELSNKVKLSELQQKQTNKAITSVMQDLIQSQDINIDVGPEGYFYEGELTPAGKRVVQRAPDFGNMAEKIAAMANSNLPPDSDINITVSDARNFLAGKESYYRSGWYGERAENMRDVLPEVYSEWEDEKFVMPEGGLEGETKYGIFRTGLRHLGADKELVDLFTPMESSAEEFGETYYGGEGKDTTNQIPSQATGRPGVPGPYKPPPTIPTVPKKDIRDYTPANLAQDIAAPFSQWASHVGGIGTDIANLGPRRAGTLGGVAEIINRSFFGAPGIRSLGGRGLLNWLYRDDEYENTGG